MWPPEKVKDAPLYAVKLVPKIYAWNGTWRDPRNSGTHQQADFVCSAPSKASIVRRIFWQWKTSEIRNVTILPYFTRIPVEPDAVYARGLNGSGPWHKVLEPGEVHPGPRLED